MEIGIGKDTFEIRLSPQDEAWIESRLRIEPGKGITLFYQHFGWTSDSPSIEPYSLLTPRDNAAMEAEGYRLEKDGWVRIPRTRR